MTWYERLTAALTSVTTSVSHGSRLRSDRYVVWQEDGSRSLPADNRHTTGVVTGSLDLYTKLEFDPWWDQFKTALDDAEGIAWEDMGTDYEEETGFWHYSLDWEVIDGG